MIVYNNFEWDVRESAACLATHGVSFKEASTVFAGDDVTISEDPASGQLRALGPSSRGRVLVVLHQRGARTRIVGATLHTTRPAKGPRAQPVAAEPVAAEPVAAEPVAAKPVAAKPVAAKPVAAKPVAESPVAAEPETTMQVASSGPASAGAAGWTAEAYGIYWEAYSAARTAARRQGKSHREAQRLGRVAGERAMAGQAAPSSR